MARGLQPGLAKGIQRMGELHRDFASAVLISVCGRLLLQQRDDVPGILYPGMIGMFGGQREGDETFRECVSREVHEEIGFLLPPDRFEALAPYAAVDPAGVPVNGQFFVGRGIPIEGLRITEGALLVVERAELASLLQRLAPPARMAARIFMADKRF